SDNPQRFSKQLVQPYLFHREEKQPQESTISESNTVQRPTRTSQNTSNDAVTVEYLPSQEITVTQDSNIPPKYPVAQENSSNDLGYSVPDDKLDVEAVGEFGQRVRSPLLRQRNNNFNRVKSRQPVDTVSSSEDYRKQHRKYFRPLGTKKLNVSESTLNTSSEDRVIFSPVTTGEPQRILKQKDIEEDTVKIDFHRNNKVTPIMTVSLGKFSGPIVVPDLPRQKKYPSAITDYLANNEAAKPIPSEPTRTKGSDAGYLAAPPVILNPLQVGVALMNAKEDLNSFNDPVTLAKDYSQDEIQPPESVVSNPASAVQNDSIDSGNSNLQNDQLSEQEQISETLNSPAHSVEIQKSVEIYHTAPIQEIHYPMEYVPNIEQPLPKQNDYRKFQKNQLFKDRRPGQLNVYKSNEITDEIIPVNSQDRDRYEYNVNENDVVYSATNGQVDQVYRPVDNKPVFGVREQLDNSQPSGLQGNPEKGQSTIVSQQPSRVVEDLSSLANLESSQGTQEVPQILLSKPTNDPTELRLLMSAPQPYPVEKIIEKTVHVPHALDVVEKTVPYPVEKVIEKQITIPQPFPVHVPIDRIVEKQIRIPYPVHVEKVIEKKIPFTIQRLIIPFPMHHFRVPQSVPIPIEKIVEKPVEKPVHISRPYSLEAAKLVKSVTIPVYNVQKDENYQPLVIRQQSFQTLPGPSYSSIGDDQVYYNTTQLYGLGYAALNRPLGRQQVVHTLPKKFGSYGVQYPHSVAYSALVNNGNSLSYGRGNVEKDKIHDEYVGPVPRKALIGIQSKSIQYSPPNIQATMRRTRQEGGNTGSFRQSKMEYGFKPPMVPSVQYDEQTATKVE
ncbi:hypothetical protein WN55_11323, partial [Dufourea novaeangliae]